ncbi:hypothetical protein GCM10022422_29630 [Flavobacterium ginsengisoli]|uniref:Uncharacterized protein n=1 Tax=Flavobacterium ginsengisoli TaxID=871694 RepID=A0ABP7FT14_9FLAO
MRMYFKQKYNLFVERENVCSKDLARSQFKVNILSFNLDLLKTKKVLISIKIIVY